MGSTDSLYGILWGAGGIASVLAADTRLGRRMAIFGAAADRTTAAGYSTVSDDNLLADALKAALLVAHKGQG